MKKIIFIIVLIASLLVIRDLVVRIYELWQKQDLMAKTHEELRKEKEKNSELKAKIEQTHSITFVEEQARNNLFLVKQGEQDILISKKLLEPQNPSLNQPESVPNWRLWMKLLE